MVPFAASSCIASNTLLYTTNMSFRKCAKLALECLVWVSYLGIGAIIFQTLERENERNEKTRLKSEIASLRGKYNISDEDINKLRDIFESPYASTKIETWKFGNAFVFAGTILTTVGEYEKSSRTTFIIMLLISLYSPRFMKTENPHKTESLGFGLLCNVGQVLQSVSA